MANNYSEPVKIKVEMSPSFTLAALNKCLFITKEHKSGEETTTKNYIKTFSSSKEVGEYYGNGSKTFKAIEYFLGQKQYPAKQPLIPDFFTIISLKTGSTYNDELIISALNELALSAEFYSLRLIDITEATEGGLNSWLNEHRKVQFSQIKTKTTNLSKRSDRLISVYSANDEDKASAYMATVITPGAGSKSDMNILSMCSADVSGGDKQELTTQNINFTEKRTSKDYVIVRTGVATDGTDITETTAIDCIIYNMIDNIEIAMAEKGFKQDDRGYSELETVISKVMGEMYNLGLIADEKGQAAFKIYPITQTEAERQLKIIRPKVLFRLADFAKTVELTLERTYGKVNE